MLRRIVSTPWFALADLLLVLLSGGLWLLTGSLPVIAMALIPWAVRLISGFFPFRRTSLDWFVLLFLGTAWLGYWAAYNQEAAWSKVWWVFLAVLLYYALAGQPVENREWVCVLFYCIGLGVAIYFFLTHDFAAQPRKLEIVNRIGRWIMDLRPRLEWTTIHPNYVAGIVAITTPFILYPARLAMERTKGLSASLFVFITLGLGLTSLAVFMTTSRGIVMAIVSACGVWFIWHLLKRIRKASWLRLTTVYPSLILIYLCLVVLILYAGPASSGFTSAEVPYGTATRAEVFVSGLYLALDFPFTGGGLGSFPGLFSHYMLGVPFFYLNNVHNLFLDVAIEQGLLGGLSFLMIFLVSIWSVAKNIVRTGLPRVQLFGWLTLGALIIAFVHGMVDDYLYNGSGTLLALALAGFSNDIQPRPASASDRKNRYIFVLMPLILVFFIMINLSGFRAAWYANLGAVQMAKVELASFPMNEWTEPAIASELEEANNTLRSALHVNSMNQTANHRLGLIAILRGDFLSASMYLERAHAAAPNHRGITKSLGYCYVWLGDMEKANLLLRNIPEAKNELDAYVWWWDIQDRHDLSMNASQQLLRLDTQKDQP